MINIYCFLNVMIECKNEDCGEKEVKEMVQKPHR